MFRSIFYSQLILGQMVFVLYLRQFGFSNSQIVELGTWYASTALLMDIRFKRIASTSLTRAE